MRHLTRMATLALLLLVSPGLVSSALASTPNTGPKPWDDPDAGVVPSNITQYAKCTVRKIIPPYQVILYDHETKDLVKMDLDESVKLRARRKKDFDGRSRLRFDDLAEGQVVKVNYRVDTGRVLEVKVVALAR